MRPQRPPVEQAGPLPSHPGVVAARLNRTRLQKQFRLETSLAEMDRVKTTMEARTRETEARLQALKGDAAAKESQDEEVEDDGEDGDEEPIAEDDATAGMEVGAEARTSTDEQEATSPRAGWEPAPAPEQGPVARRRIPARVEPINLPNVTAATFFAWSWTFWCFIGLSLI